MKITGDTLRIWRTVKGLNQQGIARKLNISQQEYSKWESKKYISSAQLLRFLDVCHCTLKELEEIQKLTPPAKRGLNLK